MKKIIVFLAVVVTLLTVSTTVFATNVNENEMEKLALTANKTIEAPVIVEEADTEIPNIWEVMRTEQPAKVRTIEDDGKVILEVEVGEYTYGYVINE